MEGIITTSIIIPVYQAEQTLGKTLDSILAQTCQDYEVIIVDDGSTDGSSQVYEAYSGRLPACRIVRQKNSGVSAARNNGIQQASGKYILFLDSDDLLRKTTLESMIRTAEEQNADLVIGNYALFKNDENPEEKKAWLKDMNSYAWLMNREDVISLFGDERTSLLGVSVWGKLYRRDLILEHGIRFPEDVNYEEDCQFNVQYYRQVRKAVRLREIVNYYRIKAQSLSRTYHEKQFGFLAEGYNQRKALASDLGIDGLPDAIDSVFYTVVLMQVKKVSLTTMDRQAKRNACQKILTQPESKQALGLKRDDVTLFTRLLARACRKQRYTEMEFLLFLWGKKKKLGNLSDRFSE